ncbi:WD40-repeat-containing domain protein [Dichotomocladium elegans]|nr:WD40-repeat-containing domain protein [Dichotomocladium elegans]
MTNHKLSCLVWNTYFKSHLLSSDYNGVISLWDINELNWLNTFSEHASRVWSVDVSAANPTLAASASDDGTVKIWSTSTSKSTMTLRVGVNVCSAKFAPSVANYVAVGAADHLVSYYDLRYPNNPVRTFPGHKRSVSYVRWLNDTEIISASTDSTLRRWDISSSDSTTIYIGHKNEKNFVGLSVSSNWISCGSEDNSVYAYHRDLRSPIANYRFANDSQNSNNNAFSTSSCWKGDSNILLAANSKGVIRALQLDD